MFGSYNTTIDKMFANSLDKYYIYISFEYIAVKIKQQSSTLP